VSTPSSAPARPTSTVRALRVLAPLGVLVMGVTIVLALASGASIGAEGAEIDAFIWGRVTFVDLALALVFGWLWIAWREASLVRAVIWFVLTAVTGSGALLAYVAIAAWQANDMRDVLVGPHRTV
jgi:hypothetical protein